MNNTNFWSENLSIGNVSVPRFMAAPMDGITDSPFRQMIRKFSIKELLITEMRHVAYIAKAAPKKIKKELEFTPIEQPLGFQFSANRTDSVEKSVQRVIEHNFVLINLNYGCPSRQVTGSGSGSALMANIPQLKKLLQAFMKAVDGRVPMTIKMRAGYKEKNALEVAQIAEDYGIDCIVLHPRTKVDEYQHDRLDFDIAKKVKESVKIPVIFSGNIDSFERAKLTYERTGADGFMIGRALMGAPWKIRQIVDESQGGSFPVSAQAALAYTLEHLNFNTNYYGEMGFNSFKKHITHYIKGIQNAAEWREKLLRSTSEEEMKDYLKQICLENRL